MSIFVKLVKALCKISNVFLCGWELVYDTVWYWDWIALINSELKSGSVASSW